MKDGKFEGKGQFIKKSGETNKGFFVNGKLTKKNDEKIFNLTQSKVKIKDLIKETNIQNKKCFISNKNKIKLRSVQHQLFYKKTNLKNKQNVEIIDFLDILIYL